MPTDDELTEVCQAIVDESLKEIPNIIGMAHDRLREVRGFQREIHELIRTRQVWARILDVPGVEKNAVHRIGMVNSVNLYGTHELSFGILILNGQAPNRYLWSDATWTRHHWGFNKIELAVLPVNKDGLIQFPETPVFTGDYMGIVSLKGKTIDNRRWPLY